MIFACQSVTFCPTWEHDERFFSIRIPRNMTELEICVLKQQRLTYWNMKFSSVFEKKEKHMYVRYCVYQEIDKWFLSG